jgi:hypothetical protein
MHTSMHLKALISCTVVAASCPGCCHRCYPPFKMAMDGRNDARGAKTQYALRKNAECCCPLPTDSLRLRKMAPCAEWPVAPVLVNTEERQYILDILRVIILASSHLSRTAVLEVGRLDQAGLDTG